MRKARLILAAVTLLSAILFACGKGGGNTPEPQPQEATLAASMNPANNSVQPPALGPYTLKVTINSVLPTAGVKIEVTAKKDDGSGSPAFFTSTNNTSTSVNDFTITGTPANTQCLVQVKLTSLSKASNTWSGSYRYSSK